MGTFTKNTLLGPTVGGLIVHWFSWREPMRAGMMTKFIAVMNSLFSNVRTMVSLPTDGRHQRRAGALEDAGHDHLPGALA